MTKESSVMMPAPNLQLEQYYSLHGTDCSWTWGGGGGAETATAVTHPTVYGQSKKPALSKVLLASEQSAEQ